MRNRWIYVLTNRRTNQWTKPLIEMLHSGIPNSIKRWGVSRDDERRSSWQQVMEFWCKVTKKNPFLHLPIWMVIGYPLILRCHESYCICFCLAQKHFSSKIHELHFQFLFDWWNEFSLWWCRLQIWALLFRKEHCFTHSRVSICRESSVLDSSP